VNVTTQPSAARTLQQLREVIADADAHKYLIHDRDSIFARHLVRISANVTDDFGNVTGLSGRCEVAWSGL
jgi:hypothetical protein